MSRRVTPDLSVPSLPTACAFVTLEWHALERPYASLRAHDERAQARLMATLALEGQSHPVLVVRREDGRFVLIDGYRRANALLAMGKDTVHALVLPQSEADALAYSHRLEEARRHSAIEEGWLVRELMETHRKKPSEVASMLGRSKSWVSRRLGLVRVLPAHVQEAVRKGQLPPHGVVSSLLPLSRGNVEHAECLVKNLGTEKVTSREWMALYTGYKSGDAEQKSRIVHAPLLFLKATMPDVKAGQPDSEVHALVRDVEAIARVSWRARERLDRAVGSDTSVVTNTNVTRAFRLAKTDFEGLTRRMEHHHERSRHTHGDLAPGT